MQTKLFLGLEARSGAEKFRDYGEGDVVVTKSGNRHVVLQKTDAYAEPALVCISLKHGGETIVLEREIAYRSS